MTRRRISDAEKAARGTLRKDRAGAFQPVQTERLKTVPPPRRGMTADATALWKLWAPGLITINLLTALDLPMFDLMCESGARLRQWSADLEKSGFLIEDDNGNEIVHPAYRVLRQERAMFFSLAKEFGMTPSARLKINGKYLMPPGEDDGARDSVDPLERILNRIQ